MLKKPAKIRPLSKKELAQIPYVNNDALLKVFGELDGSKFSRPRDWLRAQKQQAIRALPPEIKVEVESKEAIHKAEKRMLKSQLSVVTKQKQRLEKDLEAVLMLRKHTQPREIIVGSTAPKREATAIVQASDWHAEEPVNAGEVNQLNEYSLDIFAERSKWFFVNVVKLLKKEARATSLKNLVLHLGGDFITNSIHEDLMESNTLGPMSAIVLVQETLLGGIQYILDNCPFLDKITIVTSTGNHGRTTVRQRIQTELDNSIEHYMYYNLARELKSKRIDWVLQKGYHTYIQVHNTLCRFHHGHRINYGGGVGGITVPVNKAIANWNTLRHVDMDFFGHFHQFFDGGRFICNGSLIGYNAFALAIKAGFEPPRQAFTLIDAKHGKTIVAPILLEEA